MSNIRILVDRTLLLRKVLGPKAAATMLMLEYLNEVETASVAELETLCGDKARRILELMLRLGLVRQQRGDKFVLTGAGRCVLELLRELYRVLAREIIMYN